MSETNAFVCALCGKQYPLESRDWRCECGGLFDLKNWPRFDPAQIEAHRTGIGRYGALLPLEQTWEPVSLGEGDTSLVLMDWAGRGISFKLELQCPTGSFKDRGAAVLATALRGMGVERVVEDSSGNAGASLAAYAARAGIHCEICVPSTAAGPKLAQMAAYGGEVVEIKGRREYAALAAWAAAAHGAYYGSHVYNPFFLAGTETMAYEVWEQLGRRAPEVMVLPVGNGTLFLGAYRGFHRLLEAGLISHLPRLYAVQAAACAPIYQAFVAGQETVEPVAGGSTIASGIAIAHPVRGGQILAAVRASGGAVLSVTEAEIGEAYRDLCHHGLYVEQTSAVAVAALAHLVDGPGGDGLAVVPLTGHGLKTCAAVS
jgi:threonine synthase